MVREKHPNTASWWQWSKEESKTSYFHLQDRANKEDTKQHHTQLERGGLNAHRLSEFSHLVVRT